MNGPFSIAMLNNQRVHKINWTHHFSTLFSSEFSTLSAQTWHVTNPFTVVTLQMLVPSTIQYVSNCTVVSGPFYESRLILLGTADYTIAYDTSPSHA
jgi:hypothetical protein